MQQRVRALTLAFAGSVAITVTIAIAVSHSLAESVTLDLFDDRHRPAVLGPLARR